jgi:two-component system, OmpR family, response regulator
MTPVINPPRPQVRILLVEDDPALANSVSRALQSQGYLVDCTNKGEPVANSLQRDPYDLLILDVGLPGIDGFEVLRRVRSQGNHIPALILTARDAVDDRVRGLDLGADDYMTKPFALPELLARIRALSRRKQVEVESKLIHGPLMLDTAARRAWLSDKPLDVSAREWAVLEFLMQRVEKVVSKDQIVHAVAGWEELSDNAVEVYISRLRGKLEAAGIKIRTVRGFGYMLEDAGNAR